MNHRKRIRYDFPTREGFDREREAFASVFDGKDGDLGEIAITFRVMPLLWFIALSVPNLHRCWRCGKVGPDCEPLVEGNVILYCGID